jgi:hypothetical protein
MSERGELPPVCVHEYGAFSWTNFPGFPPGFTPFQLRVFQNLLRVFLKFSFGFFRGHLYIGDLLFFKSKIFNTQLVVLFKVTLGTNLNKSK